MKTTTKIFNFISDSLFDNTKVTDDERHQAPEFIDESWRASEGPTQDNNLICGLSSFTYDSAGTIHSREINILHDEMNCGLVTDTITHGMGCARNVAHRLILIHNGEILEQGPARTVLDEPKTPELRSFLGAVLV